MKLSKIAKMTAAATLAGLAMSPTVFAANPQAVSVDVDFIRPINMSLNNNMAFGYLDRGAPNTTTFTLDALSGVVTDSAANAYIISSTTNPPASASIDIDAEAVGITIYADLTGATDGSYFQFNGFNCSYNGGASTACADSDAAFNVTGSTTAVELLVGATIEATALDGLTHEDDTGSFNVYAVYQ